MLYISNNLSIPDNEISMQAVRSQGPGGQNVNKVSTAIQLRFDIATSSLPDDYKQRLLAMRDYRISSDGIINIKAQEHNSQSMNRQVALKRLREIICEAAKVKKVRRHTKPTRASQKRRMDSKTKRGQTKSLRGKVI